MFEQLKQRFEPILNDFLQSEPINALLSGKLTVEQYRAILREIFHQTRENPQLQALATVYFKGHQRTMVRSFYAHASSEIGHDQLALNDFAALGGNPTHIPYENPLPATTALLSFSFYQIYNLNPLGYLGYLFFLEFTPTQTGGSLMESLQKSGIPDNAMTFLKDHTEIDVGHNKMMERYVEQLIRDEAELDCVEYAMRTTGYLYAEMLAQAMRDAVTPIARGWNWEELKADGMTEPPR